MINNQKYDAVLFDFDGTLADTKIGIMNGAKYALHKCGLDESQFGDLKVFVGPTLWYSFETFYGFDLETQNIAVEYYREYFHNKGIYEVSLYDGILDLLKSLHSKNILIGIASAKNQSSVETTLTNLGLETYFSVVRGSLMNGERSDKNDLISSVMNEIKLADNTNVVFIGDSKTDALGAYTYGMEFIAALYDREEIEFDGIVLDKKAYTIEELANYLL